MSDMLVKLYEIEDDFALYERLRSEGILLKKVLSPDRRKVLSFVSAHFEEGWVCECEGSFANLPVSCYMAVKEGEIIGFACYDATCKNFFGPTGVDPAYRGKGVGKALLLKCLMAMRHDGYGYAIIGWTGDASKFYEKSIGAIMIDGSFPGVYRDLSTQK